MILLKRLFLTFLKPVSKLFTYFSHESWLHFLYFSKKRAYLFISVSTSRAFNFVIKIAFFDVENNKEFIDIYFSKGFAGCSLAE